MLAGNVLAGDMLAGNGGPVSGCFAEEIKGNEEEGGFAIQRGHSKESDEERGGLAEVDEEEAEREEHEAGHVVDEAEILDGVKDVSDGAKDKEKRVDKPAEESAATRGLIEADRDPTGDENAGDIEVELGDAGGADSSGEEVAVSGEFVDMADHEGTGECPAEERREQEAGLKGEALVSMRVAVEVEVRMAQEEVTTHKLHSLRR
jgi:hypothetical protein